MPRPGSKGGRTDSGRQSMEGESHAATPWAWRGQSAPGGGGGGGGGTGQCVWVWLTGQQLYLTERVKPCLKCIATLGSDCSTQQCSEPLNVHGPKARGKGTCRGGEGGGHSTLRGGAGRGCWNPERGKRAKNALPHPAAPAGKGARAGRREASVCRPGLQPAWLSGRVTSSYNGFSKENNVV